MRQHQERMQGINGGGIKRERQERREESPNFILGAGYKCRELSWAMSGWHMGQQLILMDVLV